MAMNNIYKQISVCLLGIVPVMLLVSGCSQDWNNPYDVLYEGDYEIEIRISENQRLFTFVPYDFDCVNKGHDRYLSFSVFTQPKAAVDTFLFRQSCDSLLNIYFNQQFEGKLGISALRHNGHRDTTLIDIKVHPSIFIQKRKCRDSLCLKTLVSSGAEKCMDNIREIRWSIGGKLIAVTTSVTDSLFLEIGLYDSVITAECADWFGNILESVSKNSVRCRIDSVSAPYIVSCGSELEGELILVSEIGDSGIVKGCVGSDTVKKSMTFTDTIGECTLNFAKIGLEPGLHTLRFVYSSYRNGISDEKTVEMVVSDSLYYTKLVNIPERVTVGNVVSLEAETFTRTGALAPKGTYTWTVLLNSDTLFSRSEESLKKVFFRTNREGKMVVQVQYSDLYNVSSPLFADSFSVQDGVGAVVNGMYIRTWPVHTGQNTTFVIPAGLADSSSSVTSSWSFDGDTVWDVSVIGYAGSTTFTREGKHTVWAKLINGPTNQLYSCTLSVQNGIPQLDSVVLGDTVCYSTREIGVGIFATDPSGSSIREYRVIMKCDGESLEYVSDASELGVWAEAAGPCTLFVSVINASGVQSETRIVSLTIKNGSPTLHSFSGEDHTWLFEDYRGFAVASDVDGEVRGFVIDWGDSAIDTVLCSGRSVRNEIIHSYSILPDQRKFKIKAVAFDDRMVFSDTVVHEIEVLDSRPRIQPVGSFIGYKGDTVRTVVIGDTLVTPYIEPEYIDGAYLLSVPVSFTAEGVRGEVLLYAVASGEVENIEEGDWKSDSVFLYKSASGISSLSPSSSPSTFTAFCKDGNGVVGSREFILRTDPPPNRPVVDVQNTGLDNFLVTWTGGQDSRDGVDTKVEIWYRVTYSQQFGGGVLVDTLLHSSALKNYKSENNAYVFDFALTDSYSWASSEVRIVAEDLLGNRIAGSKIFER